MNRAILTAAILLLLAPAAAAQDMPLSQILIDGEGWKKAEGNSKKPKAPNIGAILGLAFTFGPRPTAAVRSPDGGTVFVAYEGGDRYLMAAPIGRTGNGQRPLSPYCPLRVGPTGTTEVTALTVDKDGRIYAATPLGIQVFDPTGRLCGVITAPPGKVDVLGFEGDRLTAWVGNTVYFRKLKPTGVK